jgi:hypothetical protein
MTAGLIPVTSGLVTLAAVDAALSGFRASIGRTGLIRHRSTDLLASARGAGLGLGLLAGPVLLAARDLDGRGDARADYLPAGRAMLVVYLPYAVIILGAVACYAALDWRRRFLAAAVILGPGTLIRPVVAVAGAIAGALAADRGFVAALASISAVVLLGVEPLAGRLWYSGGRYPPGP